jgi:hypothetical protein
MPIRARNGKLEWRFEVNGHEYSRILDLDDTARNRIKAQRQEAEARPSVVTPKPAIEGHRKSGQGGCCILSFLPGRRVPVAGA